MSQLELNKGALGPCLRRGSAPILSRWRRAPMLRALTLRVLYALHMAAPLGLALWHVDRLNADTASALRQMFGG